MSKTIMVKEYEPIGESTILIQDSKYPAIIEVKSIIECDDKEEEKSLGYVSFYQIEQLVKGNR